MDKNTYHALSLRLNEKNDADIIKFLADKKKQTLIKRLIRDHMRKLGIEEVY